MFCSSFPQCIMQTFNSVPAPTLTTKMLEWHKAQCIVTAEHKFGVCLRPWHTVTRILKRTMSVTATLQRLCSFCSQHCLFFCPVKMWDILYEADYFFPLAELFSVSLPCTPTCLLSFLLFAVQFSTTTMHPRGHQFAIHSVLFFHSFTQKLPYTVAQLCQTHVVRPKHP